MTLLSVLVHVLTETNRHAGHADILREQVDGAVGHAAGRAGPQELGSTFWANHRAKIERAARAAAPGRTDEQPGGHAPFEESPSAPACADVER